MGYNVNQSAVLSKEYVKTPETTTPESVAEPTKSEL